MGSDFMPYYARMGDTFDDMTARVLEGYTVAHEVAAHEALYADIIASLRGRA